MAKIDYQAGMRALIISGDIKTFSDIFGRRKAPVSHVAEAAGMSREKFNRIVRDGLRFSWKEVKLLAGHFDIPPKKMLELIEADPLYKKEEDQQQVVHQQTDQGTEIAVPSSPAVQKQSKPSGKRKGEKK